MSMTALPPFGKSLVPHRPRVGGHGATGIEGSFEELVRRYQRPISSYVYRMVGDYEAALDLTRTIFIKVTGHWRATAPSLVFNLASTRSRTTRRSITCAEMPGASAHCSPVLKAINMSCR